MLICWMLRICRLKMQTILNSERDHELVVRDHGTDISCEFYRDYLALKSPVMSISNASPIEFSIVTKVLDGELGL